MYCRFCGKEIGDGSRFCGVCGRPMYATQPAVVQDNGQKTLCTVFGVFFILGGILPYLIQGDIKAYDEFLANFMRGLSGIEVIVLSCFTNFSNVFSKLFYFSSSMFTVYVGLLLIKRISKVKTSVIACAIVHAVSMVYSVGINLLIYFFPQVVFSLYGQDANMLAHGADLVLSEPRLLYFYQEDAIRRLIISMIIIILSVIFVVAGKKSVSNATNSACKISAVGSVLMMSLLPLLSLLSTFLYPAALRSYGVVMVQANSIANNTFSRMIELYAVFALMLIVVIATIFIRTKRWIFAVPTAVISIVLGCVASFFSEDLICEVYGAQFGREAFGIAKMQFVGLIIGTVVVLIAMCYWFSSVARERIPAWLQIVLPILLLVVYIVAEMLTIPQLRLKTNIPFGIVAVAVVTVLVSLLVGLKSNKQTENHHAS